MARPATADSSASAVASNSSDWLSGPAHTLSADVCVKAFKTDPKLGLDQGKVQEHVNIFGPNKLQENPPPSFWSILLRNSLNGKPLSSFYPNSFPCILWQLENPAFQQQLSTPHSSLRPPVNFRKTDRKVGVTAQEKT